MMSSVMKTASSGGVAFMSVLPFITMLSNLVVAPASAVTWLNESLPTSRSSFKNHRRILDLIGYQACNPTPCGPNTVCVTDWKGVAGCKCKNGFFPKPDAITGCGPQCTSHKECPSTYACAQIKCMNPCHGDDGASVCGTDAYCIVEKHSAICSCPTGYKGDPYFRCFAKPVENPKPKRNKTTPRPRCPQPTSSIVNTTLSKKTKKQMTNTERLLEMEKNRQDQDRAAGRC